MTTGSCSETEYVRKLAERREKEAGKDSGLDLRPHHSVRMICPFIVRSTHRTCAERFVSDESFTPNFTTRGIVFGAGWAGAN